VATVRQATATPAVERRESAEDISFQRNSVEIQPKCARKITWIANWLTRHPLAMVTLDPHGGPSPAFTGETDPGLHDRRVRSVRDALVAAGVAPERIQTGPGGEQEPLCRLATATCQEANRRVEVLVGTPKVTAERH
jgi:outer membrane protein OmpA-like peptidoglycan-associated protein